MKDENVIINDENIIVTTDVNYTLNEDNIKQIEKIIDKEKNDIDKKFEEDN